GVVLNETPRHVVEVTPLGGGASKPGIVPGAEPGGVHVSLEGRPQEELPSGRPFDETPRVLFAAGPGVHHEGPGPQVGLPAAGGPEGRERVADLALDGGPRVLLVECHVMV